MYTIIELQFDSLMCLQNSKKECDFFNSLEQLDTYDDNINFVDTCDYIESDDCKDIPIGVNDLCILQFNIRGLSSKQHKLLLLLKKITQMEQVDVIILVETWLTKESEQRLCIPGYSYHGICHQQRKGGGVGFLIRNDLNFKPRPDINCNSGIMENCFVEVITKQKNLILGSIYRPTNSNTQEFLSLFKETFPHLVHLKKEVIIGLDHNLDLLKHHLHKSTQSFLEFIIDSNYLPCISRPTKVTNSSATLLDNTLVSQNLFVKQVSSVIVDDLSDHFP